MINFLLPLALIPIYIILRRLYYTHLYSFISSSTNEEAPRPPLVADWIPFVGNALGMTKGDKFWKDVVEGYGPAVRLRAMGEVRTFVTTPALISYVYKNSKNFDFHFFRKGMQSWIFGMNYNHSQSDVMDDSLFPAHHKNMQPGSIAELIKRYADLLDEGMKELSEEIGTEGKEIDFGDRMFDILYEASAKAFFTSSFPTTQFKPIFMAFDSIFPLLNLAKLPNLARRPAEKLRDKALKIIEEWWINCSDEDKKNLAPSMGSMIECSESEGWPLRDIASLVLSEIWALEANAPYAGIWAVVELLRNPTILTRLRNEITTTVSTLDPPTISTLLHKPQPELPGFLPLTNAVFQETLRVHVDTLSLRVVQNDCIIPPHLLSAGRGAERGLSLKKGEQVICATRVPTTDEDEWGTDAGRWNPDRFLGGRRGNMNPFGGGVSMCEGRHFASAEILTFIAAFVYHFEAEIISDKLVPNLQRPGLGLQQTVGELKVKLRRREKSDL